MHANTLTGTPPSQATPIHAIGKDGGADRLRNIVAFETTCLAALKAAHPGLRHERKGLAIEWFMRVGRPLGAQGLALNGDIALDCPCCDETSELLDAMAEANDNALGRADLDAAIADEASFLDGRLRDALGTLRRTVKADLQVKGRDAPAYLSALEGKLSGMTIDLYPVESQSKPARYRPAVHIRETVEAAMAIARKRPVAVAPPAAKARPAATKPRVHATRAPVRQGRPFRMRRYSALYE